MMMKNDIARSSILIYEIKFEWYFVGGYAVDVDETCTSRFVR